MSRLVCTCSMLCLLTAAALHAEEAHFRKTVLFEEQSDGFCLYRIPGIAVTSAGTVLAYCEARKHSVADRGEIEIHLRRSVDGGRTFSAAVQVAHLGTRLPRNPVLPPRKRAKDMGGPGEQTVNNPVAVAQRSGVVHLIYCVEYMRCFAIRSEDDGVTWSAPQEITPALDAFRSLIDWQAIATGPGHGIELRNGRLVVPVWMSDYRSATRANASATIYSDDGGRTWHAGELAIPGGGEANVVELSRGDVMLTARNGDSRRRRLVSLSANGHSAWSAPRVAEELLEPGCMAGVTGNPAASDEPPHTLLFSHPQTVDRKHSERRNLTIHMSHDDGATWPIHRTLEAGPSAYSDLGVLPNGMILCFYESGTPNPRMKRKRDWAYANLTLARFNLAWVTSQATP